MNKSMSLAKKAVTLVLLLICLLAGIFFFRPDMILTPFARSSISQLGFELVAFELDSIDQNSASLGHAVLLGDGLRLTLNNVEATYTLTDLLEGRIKSLAVNALRLELFAQTISKGESEDSPSVSALLDSFDSLPIDYISLPKVEVVSENESYSAALNILSPPLQMSAVLQFDSMKDTEIEFDLRRSTKENLNLLSKLMVNDNLAIDSEVELTVRGTELFVDAISTLYVDELEQLLGDRINFPAVSIFNDALSLRSVFTLADLFGTPSISSLNISLDSPSSLFHLAQESDLGSNDLQIQLPISVAGSVAPSESNLLLNFGEIYASGSWTQESARFHAESRFAQTELSCSSISRCDMHSNWQYQLLNWEIADYSGDRLSLAATLNFDYSNNEMRLATDSMRITVPNIVSPADTAVIDSPMQLQIDDLELRVGDVISGGFAFNSGEFYPVTGIAELINPSFSGKLQLEEDVLTGVLEFDLDDRLRMGVGLQHFFLRDTGDVVVQLAAQNFSTLEPLSSLIRFPQYNSDIVAGDVVGLANISWSKQADQSWEFGGPITLKLENLSGFFADIFFVDLNTNFFAEATTPLGIQVANPLTATLANVDIGLPLTDLSWQYSFDTLSKQIQFREFEAALLGGKLDIPSIDYNPDRELNEMAVVLSDLNLESLVGLAEYPGLHVDGLISGYLPFVLEGNKITIQKGLVGALKPGGSIRYTPANPVPSSNQSLELVNQALSNYQYQTMNTEVFYDSDGELLMRVQLEGRNPDMNNGQAINLNVNISDNIPSLLKSLQASRVISDELERVLQKR